MNEDKKERGKIAEDMKDESSRNLKENKKKNINWDETRSAVMDRNK